MTNNLLHSTVYQSSVRGGIPYSTCVTNHWTEVDWTGLVKTSEIS